MIIFRISQTSEKMKQTERGGKGKHVERCRLPRAGCELGLARSLGGLTISLTSDKAKLSSLHNQLLLLVLAGQ